MTETHGTAETGWYADPADPGTLRWWDGNAWTDTISMRSGSTPPIPDATELRRLVSRSRAEPEEHIPRLDPPTETPERNRPEGRLRPRSRRAEGRAAFGEQED